MEQWTGIKRAAGALFSSPGSARRVPGRNAPGSRTGTSVSARRSASPVSDPLPTLISLCCLDLARSAGLFLYHLSHDNNLTNTCHFSDTGHGAVPEEAATRLGVGTQIRHDPRGSHGERARWRALAGDANASGGERYSDSEHGDDARARLAIGSGPGCTRRLRKRRIRGPSPRRYLLRDPKAFQIGIAALTSGRSLNLGSEHGVAGQPSAWSTCSASGCHRFDKADKAEAYWRFATRPAPGGV